MKIKIKRRPIEEVIKEAEEEPLAVNNTMLFLFVVILLIHLY